MIIYEAMQEIEKDNTKVFTNGQIVLKHQNGKIAICDMYTNYYHAISTIDLGVDWIEMQKPQPKSFIEALNSHRDCWVEHPYISWETCSNDNNYTRECFYNLIHHKPQPMKNVLHILGWKCSSNNAFIDVIENGTWYIEEQLKLNR